MLKAFIHVRLFASATIPKGMASSIPKKKGSVKEAEDGVRNLLLVAYEGRELEVKLP